MVLPPRRPPNSLSPPGPPSPPTAPVYAPARLSRRSLEVEVTAGMRQLAPEDRDGMVAQKRAFLARFDLRAPRRWNRIKRFVVGGAVFLPPVNMLVTSIGLKGYLIQVLVGAAYGLLLGMWRLTPIVSGLATIAAGGATVALGTGDNLFSFRLGCLLAMVCYYVVGHILGVGDDLTRDETD